MNRLAHNRALLLILAVFLQVGLLPGVASVRCSMSPDGWFSCCCDPAMPDSEAPASPSRVAATHGCCGEESPDDETPDEEGVTERVGAPAPAGGTSTCRCAAGGGSEPPVAAPERDRSSLDDGLPCDVTQRAGHGLAASKRVALCALPRATTGPPIHLVLQVFTI